MYKNPGCGKPESAKWLLRGVLEIKLTGGSKEFYVRKRGV